MLQIKNVNLNVGNTALLSNINLTLEQGKNYGVLVVLCQEKVQIKYNQFSLFM